MKNYNRMQFGREAEEQACQYLLAKGLLLIEKNYRHYNGEIDLIMKDKDDIVFVEVRSRSRSDYGNAIETINWAKQKKLIKTATLYLQWNKLLDKVTSRFDVVTLQTAGGSTTLEWIKNAFCT